MDAVLIHLNQDAEQFEEPTFLFGDFFFGLLGQDLWPRAAIARIPPRYGSRRAKCWPAVSGISVHQVTRWSYFPLALSPAMLKTVYKTHDVGMVEILPQVDETS